MGNLERARWRYLARSGSQSQRSIRFIFRAYDAYHIRGKITECWLAETEDIFS